MQLDNPSALFPVPALQRGEVEHDSRPVLGDRNPALVPVPHQQIVGAASFLSLLVGEARLRPIFLRTGFGYFPQALLIYPCNF